MMKVWDATNSTALQEAVRNAQPRDTILVGSAAELELAKRALEELKRYDPVYIEIVHPEQRPGEVFYGNADADSSPARTGFESIRRGVVAYDYRGEPMSAIMGTEPRPEFIARDEAIEYLEDRAAGRQTSKLWGPEILERLRAGGTSFFRGVKWPEDR